MPYLTASQFGPAQPCIVFQLLAYKTWSDLQDGYKLGLTISEESVTDFLLLDLKRALPNNIFVQKFTKAEEGRTTGADWEWWFVGSERCFGMRIQAKKLSPHKLKYLELTRLVGTTRKFNK